MELVVRHGEREETLHVERTVAGYRVQVGEAVYEVDATAAQGSVRSLLVDGKQYEVSVRHAGDGCYAVTSTAGTTRVELIDPLAHLARQSHAGVEAGGKRQLTAYMPGVVRLRVAVGDAVEAGQTVAVLEAMKMENEIVAEGGGTVSRILVEDGQAVEGGDALIELE